MIVDRSARTTRSIGVPVGIAPEEETAAPYAPAGDVQQDRLVRVSWEQGLRVVESMLGRYAVFLDGRRILRLQQPGTSVPVEAGPHRLAVAVTDGTAIQGVLSSVDFVVNPGENVDAVAGLGTLQPIRLTRVAAPAAPVAHPQPAYYTPPSPPARSVKHLPFVMPGFAAEFYKGAGAPDSGAEKGEKGDVLDVQIGKPPQKDAAPGVSIDFKGPVNPEGGLARAVDYGAPRPQPASYTPGVSPHTYIRPSVGSGPTAQATARGLRGGTMWLRIGAQTDGAGGGPWHQDWWMTSRGTWALNTPNGLDTVVIPVPPNVLVGIVLAAFVGYTGAYGEPMRAVMGANRQPLVLTLEPQTTADVELLTDTDRPGLIRRLSSNELGGGEATFRRAAEAAGMSYQGPSAPQHQDVSGYSGHGGPW